MAEIIHFDTEPVGAIPSGWSAGVTGRGSHHWSVEADATAPSPPNVLKQSGRGDFPWCVVRDARLADGFIEVRFKPLTGAEDQAGGVVWRWKDGDHYYVARANALENNVSLYYTQNGRRNTIKYVTAPVAAQQWHYAARRVRRQATSASYSTASLISSSTTSILRERVLSESGPRPTASRRSTISRTARGAYERSGECASPAMGARVARLRRRLREPVAAGLPDRPRAHAAAGRRDRHRRPCSARAR